MCPVRNGRAPVRTDVSLTTGIRVRVMAQGDPDGRPLVLLPAYADSWFSYSRVLAKLPESIRAYAVDPRGHGDSDRPACCYDVPSFAADVVAMLDAMEVERASLIGHSGSCFVVRCVAETFPDRVDRLVLIASPVALDREQVAPFARAIHDLVDPVPPEFISAFQRAALHARLTTAFFDRLVAESSKVPAAVWRAALEGLLAFDDRAAVSAIRAPTLLLWGDQDSIVSRTDQAELAALIPGASLEIYEGVGHSPNWERPEVVARSIESFLETRPALG